MKSSFVSDCVENQTITELFAVSSKGSVTKYKNKPGFWFGLSLSDKTGTMDAKFWGKENDDDVEIQKFFASFSIGDIVRVSGRVSSYQNKLDLNIDEKVGNVLKKVEDGEYDLEDFMKKSSRDIPQMIAELHQIVSEINNEHIKKLLESFTNDDDFMKKKYSQAPAGKMWHHNFVGGLLEHVLSLISMSKTIQQSHPELNLDLLIATCILHDIGKVVEYKITTAIEITTEGRLFGHLSIGYFMVAQRISEMSDFPEDLRLRILHMILSHHRQLSQGAPVVPMFPEAVAFALIDDADAQSQHMIQVVEDSKEDWEYERLGSKWNWTKPMDDNQ
jgi:3'-5' exoribonuclease